MSLGAIGVDVFEMTLADGKTYRIAPLTIGVMADLSRQSSQRKKKEYLETIHALYGSSPPPAEVAVEVNRELKAIRDSEDDFDIFTGGYDGFRFLFWRCLQEYNPSITEDMAGKLLTISALNVFKDMIVRQVQGITGDEKKTIPSPSPE